MSFCVLITASTTHSFSCEIASYMNKCSYLCLYIRCIKQKQITCKSNQVCTMQLEQLWYVSTTELFEMRLNVIVKVISLSNILTCPLHWNNTCLHNQHAWKRKHKSLITYHIIYVLEYISTMLDVYVFVFFFFFFHVNSCYSSFFFMFTWINAYKTTFTLGYQQPML